MRPYALSIAGFDPSGGAGLLADCKTLEANEVYGLGVCTALTMQNDVQFERVSWVSAADMQDQARLLFAQFPIDYVKIGLLESIAQLPELLGWLRSQNPQVRIVWDPVLKASAGYEFHAGPPPELVAAVGSSLALLTPNRPEMLRLWPAASAEEAAAAVSAFCPVLLKGGHDEGASATDILYQNGEPRLFSAPRLPHGEKHGSGCVLSAAVLAQLARGASLEEACRAGKAYTTTVLASNPTLLGYHFTSL
ncbi:hydroxymethylpyrimidine/phosphomethylpyrimidine kinase [Hymenobacter sp. BT186]|uniref:hydroxymethylpyrimidine kinase n=1 Tax=Hymenobacter telluris TaxID=2816474 RepID=A0A939JD60_9BACT|nr:hydroxymethylpyrimidine/phosphomethylpyrimidine kinase [Hymenobacter telluris]MBO0358017.1 hydroxymethylpyrimidine/phosphomethylpyrimidine kinase [Hymenobacter telluris]MBW3374044.1 hydroxymethylpyrimidine/phosphomethylpyrimidine kinase [Hymenobacter norwichensis]